ncbi:penicillin-binding protein 2 [Oscillatoria sp. FACHB-1406]|uniref:penicillin-binding protein 2 n=1 Tax=Oscillatoria sp. FACHB-1406 TaxID=2692846 RepID=UPI001688159F|nr:penicillin-binding protein 2 [Oscillatoria sp. FACHB-1406]MBD2579775.1 penicillin-binding protein 2 [Oscillatoria sp. FACHB-1406]
MTQVSPLNTVNPISKAERKGTQRTVGSVPRSIFIMTVISLLLLGGIGSRLTYLQAIEGQHNRELAENNRIRLIPRHPVRGTIFDRKGRVLANSSLSHSAFVWPLAQSKPTWPQTVKRLSQILDIPEAEIREKVAAAGNNSVTLVRIARGLDVEKITALEEYSQELDGVTVDIEHVRAYPLKGLGAHVLGYTGELNAEEFKERRKEGYRLGDIVGKMGVEESLEPLLRGEWGGQQVEVNGQGKVVRVLGQKESKAGQDVTITLDANLQKAAESALGSRKGAVVALNPNNGAVLAMVSYPTFDPNIFSGRITPQTWKELQGEGNPFVNRTMRGFPPASTFKVVTATAGMESGKFSPDTYLNTFAYLNVGGTAFGEWNKAGFGTIGFVRALAMSSNTFFGQIGRGVGGPTLIDWSRRYGFGEKTGIDLSGESKGLIADEEWKQKNYNDKWAVGDTINMSIGQGFTQATPLQIAVMFSVIANGGDRVKPHLLEDNRDAQEWRKPLNLKPTTLETIRNGLRSVVTSGTAAALNYVPMAGKSGTAEAPPGPTHAWFGGYAPYDKPEIVVVAFVEHSGGGGGKTAGPIVAKVIQSYLQDKAGIKPEETKPEKVGQAEASGVDNDR